MSFSISYRPLCTLQLWHGYHLLDASQPNKYFFELSDSKQEEILKEHDIRDLFEIIPTPTTQQKLKKGKMVFRTTNSGGIIYVSVEEDKITPMIEPADYFSLAFGIYPKDPLLLNYSNIHLDAKTKERALYLSNVHRNKSGDHQFLTKPIQTFDSSAEYLPGDYVNINLAGDLTTQEALQFSPGTPGTGTGGWASIPVFQYAHRQDQIRLLSRSFRLDFRGQGINKAHLILTRQLDNQRIVELELAYEDLRPLDNYHISLPDTPEGKYEMKVMAGSSEIVEMSGEVFVSDGVASGAFGIIELVHSDLLGEFALLNSGQLKSELEFVSFIPNRRTFWRYVFKSTNASTPIPPITPSTDFNSEDDHIVISNSVKPLTQVYQPTIAVQGGSNVPNPTTNLIKPDKASGKIISETFIFQNLTS